MMIHDFPPHKIFRRSHRPGRSSGETSIVISDSAVMPQQQPLPHSGTWGWVIRNDNVTFWTYDPALVAAATAQKDAGNAHYRSGAHAEAMTDYLECLELLGANPLGCSHLEWRRCVLGRVRAAAEGNMHQISTSTPAIDPVTLFQDVNMLEGSDWVPSNFWGCFRWNRTLADNHLHDDDDRFDDRFAALVREEEDAYVELLTPEEQMLHATSLSNYAMAAIATLRARGMTDEQWRVGADFDYKAAIPGPCIYLKMHRAGAGSKTVPLVVDGEMGADGRSSRMTVGQVKVLIAKTQGIPSDQQWIYYGGVLLAAPSSAPESCAEAESLRRTLWQVSESDPEEDSDLKVRAFNL